MAALTITATPSVDGRAREIAMDLDYETVGQGSTLMVTASGTAVRLC